LTSPFTPEWEYDAYVMNKGILLLPVLSVLLDAEFFHGLMVDIALCGAIKRLHRQLPKAETAFAGRLATGREGGFPARRFTTGGAFHFTMSDQADFF